MREMKVREARAAIIIALCGWGPCNESVGSALYNPCVQQTISAITWIKHTQLRPFYTNLTVLRADISSDVVLVLGVREDEINP